MTWINIKDQTPPEGDCLIMIDSVPNRRIALAYYDPSDGRFWERSIGYQSLNLTHWQPLPAYPEVT